MSRISPWNPPRGKQKPAQLQDPPLSIDSADYSPPFRFFGSSFTNNGLRPIVLLSYDVVALGQGQINVVDSAGNLVDDTGIIAAGETITQFGFPTGTVTTVRIDDPLNVGSGSLATNAPVAVKPKRMLVRPTDKITFSGAGGVTLLLVVCRTLDAALRLLNQA